ncbi:MAG: hypothetical protein AB7K24_17790 [Gemmataceae bacterium]
MKGFVAALGLIVLSASQVSACGPTPGSLVPHIPGVRTLVKGAVFTCHRIDFADDLLHAGIPGGRFVQAPMRLAAYPVFTSYVFVRDSRERLMSWRRPFGTALNGAETRPEPALAE